MKGHFPPEPFRISFPLPELLDPVAELVAEDGLSPDLEAALEQLIAAADVALEAGPFSVTQQELAPPDRIDPDLMNLRHRCYQHKPLPEPSEHDFRTIATYRFPNPETPDGLPWVMQGRHNPDIEHDRTLMRNFVSAVNLLAEAYHLTGRERYAEGAVRHLRTWFLDPGTRMTPHLTYAEHIPGEERFKEGWQPRCVGWKDGQRFHVAYGGLISGLVLSVLVQNFPLLRPARAWTDQVEGGLREWFFDFLRWIIESALGKDEAIAPNNHASWYCTQKAAYAELTGDDESLASVLDREVKVRIFLQIEPDGSQPAELGRHVSWRYVTMATISFLNTALIGDRHGRDLWRYRTADGRGIQGALEWLVERVRGEKPIEGRNVEGVEYVRLAPLLATAAMRYKNPAYADLIEDLPGYPPDHRYRLLYPSAIARRLATA